MSKAKNKYKNWCSKEQYNYVINYHRLMSEDIQLYRISDDIRFYPSLKKDIQKVADTVKVFASFSNDDEFEYTFINKVKNTICPIKENDVVFNFNGRYCLYNTYKILGFIRESVTAYLLSNSNQFSNGTIAEYKREKDFHLLQYTKYKKRFFEPQNIFKGTDLLNAFLYRNLYLRKEFTKYFLSYYSIIGVDNIKLLDNDKIESKVMKNTLKVFMSGQVDKKDCAKSLLSVLYYYLQFKMRINKNKALQVAKDLVYDVFNVYYEYKGSEVIKNVYVKEVIGSHVVYSFDTKKELITNSNKEYLEKAITNSIVDTDKFPKQMIRPSLDNPLRLYSLMTPSELLQKI